MTDTKPLRNAKFMAPVQPDALLAAIVGSDPLPRTQITVKLWAYIKANGLQDKTNRRKINADEPLKAVFNGASSVTMFEMPKLVYGHTTAVAAAMPALGGAAQLVDEPPRIAGGGKECPLCGSGAVEVEHKPGFYRCPDAYGEGCQWSGPLP